MRTATMQIAVEKVKVSRLPGLDVNNLVFGRVFSDHMFISDYTDGNWTENRIVPYADLPMSPASSVIHYGQSIFEGMKAYRSDSGEILLFRPLDNHKRLNRSAHRMAMPDVPEEVFMEGLRELLLLDKGWIPDGEGRSLYIRPFHMATDEYIGVKASDNYKFMIITSPVGHYYSEPLRVMIETQYFRAVQGGVGATKVSGNYGRSHYPTQLAKQKGYDQLIWTDSREHRYVEESGTMNLMFVIDDVLITPPLGDTILAGITRDSVLTLARDWGMKVQERRIAIDEIMDAFNRGVLQEAFGTGTAATIAQISVIGHAGIDYTLPPVAERKFSNKVNKALDDIRRGRAEDKHGWVVKIS